jgi:GH25 family lysozyme M1 (1,4-beta-N-acetylmuramidase)
MLRVAAAGGVAAALSLALAPGARAAAATVDGGTRNARGVDISAYQHTGPPIEWRLLFREGIRFVGIKAAEGTYYVNPYYGADARGAAKAGLAVLPYVFANPARAGGAATASFALARASRARGRLPLVVDLENDPYTQHADCYGLGVPAMLGWIAGFSARASALTGRPPVIYTTAAWWQECTGNTGKFRRDPLWLAAFGGTPPTPPPAWRRWTFLQYDNNGTLPGIGQVDLDYYRPDSALPALRIPAKNSRARHAKLHRAKPRHPKPRHPKPNAMGFSCLTGCG